MARVSCPHVVVNNFGQPLPGASVTIRRRSDEGQPIVYDAEVGGSTIPQSLATDDQGRIEGWVFPGAYELLVVRTRYDTYIEPWEAVPCLPPSCHVYRSTLLEIPSELPFTAVPFDNELWDTDGMHSLVSDTKRLTAQTPGFYSFSGHASFEGQGDSKLLGIRLNGSNLIAEAHIEDFGGESPNVIWPMDVDDYVELVALHYAGVPLDLVIEYASIAFQATWIGVYE